MLPALTQETLMYARRIFAIAIATLCIHGLAFAQSVGTTTLHDFDGAGDLSSLRTDRASFELVDGGRADRGRALRISFDAVPETQDAYPALVFEKSSLPYGDFSQIGALGFWVKVEGDSGAQILISVWDLDGKRSLPSPSRVYVRPGAWHHVVCRLELEGLDRKRIGSLQLHPQEPNRPARSFLVDDFELYSPLAGRLVSLEDQIRRSLRNVQARAKQIGLEIFIEADTERLTQRFRDASSLAASERLLVLSQLAREAASLAGRKSRLFRFVPWER